MTDRSSSWERRPSLDLYFQRNFKNQQSLILNVVGTYMDSNSKRHYKEMQNTETLTDLFSNVDGNKYSIIGEGIYEKTFKAGRLSTGIKHTQSFTDNEYTGSSVSKTDMRQADTYMGEAMFITLPGDFGILISAKKFVNSDGSQPNKTGILPDIEVKRDYNAYLKGRDNVLERAIEELWKQVKK